MKLSQRVVPNAELLFCCTAGPQTRGPAVSLQQTDPILSQAGFELAVLGASQSCPAVDVLGGSAAASNLLAAFGARNPAEFYELVQDLGVVALAQILVDQVLDVATAEFALVPERLAEDHLYHNERPWQE